MVVKNFARFVPKFKSIGLHHDNPEVFAMSQWQFQPRSIIYLVYRWIFAILFTLILVYSMTLTAQNGQMVYWAIYLTNQGLFICTVYSIFSAIFVTLYHFKAMNLENSSFWYKIYWILSNVSIVLAFLITIVYWTALYDFNSGSYQIDYEITLIY
jgi:hypothetical protein